MLLAHDHEGDGADVVFLHAAIGDRRLWDDQWAWVPASYRAIRCDLRGFGESRLPPNVFSHGADVIELVESMHVERAVFVAGSLGGRVALELAVARPDLVTALVLISPGLVGWEWSSSIRTFGAAEDEALERGDIDAAVELNMHMWFDGLGRSSDAVDPERRAAVAGMQRRAFQLQLEAGDDAEEQTLVDDLRARLADIEAPALVAVGEHDASDFHAIGRLVAAEMPRADFVTLPDTAHVPNYERPSTFDAFLAGALARLA